jgi:hypothetical protein
MSWRNYSMSKVVNLSEKKKEAHRELTRKRTIETLFDRLKTTEERAMLLLLVQSYKDEIEDLKK